jgi:hypothetical protein
LLDGIVFCGFGMEKKSSAPHSRLACIHLQASQTVISDRIDRVTVRSRRVKQKQHLSFAS